MKVVFDPGKNARNLAKHGLSLADFAGFEIAVGTIIDTRTDYGEVRFRAVVRIDGRGYAIAYTKTDEGIRLISFRRAHEEELRRYE